MIKNKSMLCVFYQQQSKIHVLSASPDLHGSFLLCLLPQARTSDLTYDVGVEVDYFEYISFRGSFSLLGKKLCALNADSADCLHFHTSHVLEPQSQH